MSRHYCYFPQAKTGGHAANPLDYGLFKGRLNFVAPFDPTHDRNASPHYILRMEAGGAAFNVAVNTASSVPNGEGSEEVLFYLDPDFQHTLLKDLAVLPEGLHRDGFTKLDYLRTTGLLKMTNLTPIADVAANSQARDLNDVYNQVIGINTAQAGEEQGYFNGKQQSSRMFYRNNDPDIVVYTFGFIYPTNDGLHETHMNQGNPAPHASENGVGQDGAVIIYKGGKYYAFFTAFATQEVPTDDASGDPSNTAAPLEP